MIAMAVLFGAVALASNISSDNAARALGVAVVIILLLYEPLFVTRFGGTLGHIWTNLRVVDDRGGNVGFGKALVRFLIKSLLGWYSFLTMPAETSATARLRFFSIHADASAIIGA